MLLKEAENLKMKYKNLTAETKTKNRKERD